MPPISVGVTGVQFKLDGVNLGAAVTGAGPTYSISWNTAAVTNGPHTLSAVATDAAGNTATASIPVTMNNTPPTVSSPAAANPNPVTGTTTALSVLGTDQAGGTDLTYTWSATGPSPVVFSSNGTNSSNNTTATFQAAGSYTLQVSIQNSDGLTTTSGIAVAVNPTVTKVTVNPPSATVVSHSNQQFTASLVDQFGKPMSQPAESIGWTDLSNTVMQNVCPPDNYGGHSIQRLYFVPQCNPSLERRNCGHVEKPDGYLGGGTSKLFRQ